MNAKLTLRTEQASEDGKEIGVSTAVVTFTNELGDEVTLAFDCDRANHYAGRIEIPTYSPAVGVCKLLQEETQYCDLVELVPELVLLGV